MVKIGVDARFIIMTGRGRLPGGKIRGGVFRHLDHGECREFQTFGSNTLNTVIEFANPLSVLAACGDETAISVASVSHGGRRLKRLNSTKSKLRRYQRENVFS